MIEPHSGSGPGQGVDLRAGTDVSDMAPPVFLSDHILEGSTAEESLNDKTAEWLRSYGLAAEAEQRIPDIPGGERSAHKLDVVVEMDNECVVLEAEFHPAGGVRGDALKRLPENAHLTWRGMPITKALTIVYPEEYRRMPESYSKQLLVSCEELPFQPVERDAEGSIVWGAQQTGSLGDLANLLASYWTRSSTSAGVDKIVRRASEAIDAAAGILANDPYIQQPHDDSDPAATCALVWLNALLFQELLASDLTPANIPPPYTGQSIPVPQHTDTPSDTLRDWEFILEINWYPIFDLAQRSLPRVAAPRNKQALDILRRQAKEMAQEQAIRRHDIAGRVFHRLLSSRKFLATNYTTIPAAVLLAGLAFGSEHGPLGGKALHDEEALAENLRIVDPACGSGTLLMAALQELLAACRRSKSAAGDMAGGTVSLNLKPLLEKSLYGFDVVPGAQHLTNTTLSMAETTQVLSGLPIYVVPHDCHPDSGQPRLGSLDFLRRAPNHGSTTSMELFPSPGAATRVTGTGEHRRDLHLPKGVDLFICNPPYTRAGGPGNEDHTAWNPMFGSVLSKRDKAKMNSALRKTLATTIGSLYAGLGSAFVALIDQEIRLGGMVALVLPLTAITGSRWRPVREKLLKDYVVEWVVVSHDLRHRPKRASLPGRQWVSFSESTRIAETLVVAVRRENPDPSHHVKFVNLRYNPDEPADAMALTRALLNSREGHPVSGRTSLLSSEIACPHPTHKYGEILSIPQGELTGDAWAYTAFTQSTLMDSIVRMRIERRIGSAALPLTTLGHMVDLGPYHMQIKGRDGLFDCRTGKPGPLDLPALWHHKSNEEKTLTLDGNAVLTRRIGKQPAQDRMLQRHGHLHLASELRHAPQRLAAAYTNRKMLGISSWITLLPKQPRLGVEETLCLWLNSTPGLLLRIVHANRPYLGRSRLPHELASTMPALNIDSLSAAQLRAGLDLFGELKGRTLQGFAHINTDPVRQELNHRLVTEVLGGNYDTAEYVASLTEALSLEPLLTARH